MRENKFRAFDKFNEDMFFSGERLSKFFQQVERLIKGGNHVVVTQYTGLKDKNENPIYESDLIKNERGRIARVDFNKYCACFDAVFVSDDPEYYNPSKDRAYGFQSNMWGGHVEVIGNIYQSPELLEESK